MTFNKLTPPLAGKKPVTTSNHGIERIENYAWLRADNWQEVMRDPSVLADDIRAYLVAENDYTKAYFEDTNTLQETLFQEMKARIKEDDSSVPSNHGPYAYSMRYVTGGQHPHLLRTDHEGDNEEVLLDGDKEAKGKAYFRLGGLDHADNHKLGLWSYDDKGSEYFTLKVRDLETGNDLEDVIEETTGGGIWDNACASFFYVKQDENHRPSKVFRHIIGTDPATDTLIYEEADPGFFVGVGKTSSDRFITIDTHDHQTSESYLIDADKPESAPRLIAKRELEIEYSIDDLGDGRLIISTNADGAADFKLVTAPSDNPSRENWSDYVAYEPGRLIKSMGTYKNHLVWLEVRNALPQIVIQRLSDGESHVISFDEEAYSLGLGGGYEYDTTSIRISYSSMTTPSQTYDYDMETRERVLRKEQEIPSGHDASDYVTHRLQAPSSDGTLVPVTLLHRKDTPIDGSAPLLLYGYGSYGMSMPASFSTTRLSLVDRGFVYAIAHIRGGMEKGDAWYKAGKREHKQNTFKDFIAAGEYLANEGYTTRGNIVSHGGSAGGMLMGACMNMAPDLFGGCIAAVPFVDVLTTMLDDTLPLTPPEWPEWGNPIESVEDYKTIAAYSPIDNVRAQAYPPILALGGLTDPRVTYWEPAKWVATLRERKTDDNPLLLKTHMDSGHSGASGRFDSLKETAQEYAFALKVMGKNI
ncbi:MAG: S9 family peptidase [Hyphomicrobiales bacterium]